MSTGNFTVSHLIFCNSIVLTDLFLTFLTELLLGKFVKCQCYILTNINSIFIALLCNNDNNNNLFRKRLTLVISSLLKSLNNDQIEKLKSENVSEA